MPITKVVLTDGRERAEVTCKSGTCDFTVAISGTKGWGTLEAHAEPEPNVPLCACPMCIEHRDVRGGCTCEHCERHAASLAAAAERDDESEKEAATEEPKQASKPPASRKECPFRTALCEDVDALQCEECFHEKVLPLLQRTAKRLANTAERKAGGTEAD